VKQEHRFSKRYASTRVGGAICLLGWRVAGNAKMARPAGACREREHRDTAFVPPTRSLLRSGVTDLRARVSARVSSSRMPRRTARPLPRASGASRRMELV